MHLLVIKVYNGQRGNKEDNHSWLSFGAFRSLARYENLWLKTCMRS